LTYATRVTVLIADDHEATREDVRYALEQDETFEVVADVRHAPDAVAAAVELQPDLCLLDIHMPGGGIAAAAEIHARVPRTRIVMLTVSGDDDDLLAALEAGASGYLLKDIHPKRLPDALLGVLKGEVALPRALVARLVAHVREGSGRRGAVPPGLEAHLTRREWQVLDLLRQDVHVSDIAARLVLSVGTVSGDVKSITRKLRLGPEDAPLRESRWN
jgi:DNA-binding NarL/FixJ family response regulator